MNKTMVRDPKVYNLESAAWIAREHATGATLLELHQAHESTVPDPVTIKRWRREFPAFDLLMVEAEHVRADVLADQTLAIADSDKRTAGAARNSIQVRQWLAARLNEDRYGQRKPGDTGHPYSTPPGVSNSRPMAAYSDADLQQIIRAGLKQGSIEGQSKLIDQATPVPPPVQETAGSEQEDGTDPSRPKISEEKPFAEGVDKKGHTVDNSVSDHTGAVKDDKPEF